MFSNGCIEIGSMPVLASASQFASGWSNVMVGEFGSNRSQEKGQPSSSPSQGGNPAPSPPRLTLLIAEDNLPDALIVKEAIKLERLPLDIHIASDGEQALEFVQRTLPDALILDLNLPKLAGFEVLRAIRADPKLEHLPVMVATSSDSSSDRSEAAQLGASYFRKPVTYAEFMKIGAYLREFLTMNNLL